ncbi:helix-turn-helix transcriptional regulator [Kribbella sp. NPDC051718]|uniref:helix-turn-helix transcriptional regulator n=1 Tax=Kribbella sp. NPDC051718 TaxID=3155168 RepID=UPI003447EBDE
MAELRATFDVVAVTWQWRTAAGQAGFDIDRPEVLAGVTEDQRTEWSTPAFMRRHPLVRWYDVVQDPRAQTTSRVPRSFVPEQDRRLAIDFLRPVEGDQQLSLPYVLGPTEHLAFVLARGRRDFSDDDLLVARRLQPALVALHRQSRAFASAGRSAARTAEDAGLTGREFAVLRLLADGHTAHGIARRLVMSERTVHKHLEHIYPKLGVHDRLTAVRVASDLGVLASHSAEIAGSTRR